MSHWIKSALKSNIPLFQHIILHPVSKKTHTKTECILLYPSFPWKGLYRPESVINNGKYKLYYSMTELYLFIRSCIVVIQ